MLESNAAKVVPSATGPQGDSKPVASPHGAVAATALPGFAPPLGGIGAGPQAEGKIRWRSRAAISGAVRCSSKRPGRPLRRRTAAVREHAFDKLLSSNGIVTIHQESRKSSRAENKAASPQDVVQVAATDQIVAILSQLTARHDAFPTVSIEPAGGVPWQQRLAQCYRRADGDKEADASIGFGGARKPPASPPAVAQSRRRRPPTRPGRNTARQAAWNRSLAEMRSLLPRRRRRQSELARLIGCCSCCGRLNCPPLPPEPRRPSSSNSSSLADPLPARREFASAAAVL